MIGLLPTTTIFLTTVPPICAKPTTGSPFGSGRVWARIRSVAVCTIFEPLK